MECWRNYGRFRAGNQPGTASEGKVSNSQNEKLENAPVNRAKPTTISNWPKARSIIFMRRFNRIITPIALDEQSNQLERQPEPDGIHTSSRANAGRPANGQPLNIARQRRTARSARSARVEQRIPVEQGNAGYTEKMQAGKDGDIT